MLGDDVFNDLDTFLQSSGFEYEPKLGHLADTKRCLVQRLVERIQGGYANLCCGDLYDFVQDLKNAQLLDQEDPDGESCFEVASRVVKYQLAYASVSELDGIWQRALNLSFVERPSEASKKARSFFAHVGRSYLQGFFPECVVMCRSVLESEFTAEIATDDCIEVLGSRGSLPFDLADRIAVAARKGRLTGAGVDASNRVRKLGNEAIHRNPGKFGETDARDAILASMPSTT